MEGKMRIIGIIISVALVFNTTGLAFASDSEALQQQMRALQQQLQQHQEEMLARQQADQEKLKKLSESLQTLSAQMGMASLDAEAVQEDVTTAQSDLDGQRLAKTSAKSKANTMDHLNDDKQHKGLLAFLKENWDRGPQREAEMMSQRDMLKRETPSGRYGDPSSFFFLHGYTTVTYADFENQFGTAPGETSQILVAGSSARSGKHESGFKNDTALFIGSELSNNLKGVFEIHFVGNARDPVITESKITWEPIETEEGHPSLRITGGRYWWPFGAHSHEWFSALNNFNLLSPAAAEVLPAHFNELGVMLEGEWLFKEDLGVNYLVSVGNGVSSFELSDNVGGGLSNTYDHDSNRTVTTRLGVFPGVENFNFGLSFAKGALRDGIDTSYAVTDSRRYQSDFEAYGVDANYTFKKLDLSGYWYFSEETLDGGAALTSLDRNGGTLDVIYNLTEEAPLFKDLDLKLRASTVKDATLSNGTFRRSQYGFGINARPHEFFLLKAEYYIQTEDNIPDIDNDGFVLSGTVEF